MLPGQSNDASKSLPNDGHRLDPAALPLGQYVDEIQVDDRASVVDHIVVLLHGIRTNAEWQRSVQDVLETNSLVAKLIRYDYFDAFRFVMPIWTFRLQVIDEVTSQIEFIRSEHPNAQLSVIAHSFGTYVLAEILKRQIHPCFHRLILCGSIVRKNFPWRTYRRHFYSIINECGSRDRWPLIAEIVTFGYGASGRLGFSDHTVENRYHHNLGHSDFFNRDFASHYWLSFIEDGKIRRITRAPTKVGLFWQILRLSKIKYVVWLIILILFIRLVNALSDAIGFNGIIDHAVRQGMSDLVNLVNLIISCVEWIYGIISHWAVKVF